MAKISVKGHLRCIMVRGRCIKKIRVKPHKRRPAVSERKNSFWKKW